METHQQVLHLGAISMFCWLDWCQFTSGSHLFHGQECLTLSFPPFFTLFLFSLIFPSVFLLPAINLDPTDVFYLSESFASWLCSWLSYLLVDLPADLFVTPSNQGFRQPTNILALLLKFIPNMFHFVAESLLRRNKILGAPPKMVRMMRNIWVWEE